MGKLTRRKNKVVKNDFTYTSSHPQRKFKTTNYTNTKNISIIILKIYIGEKPSTY